MDNMTKNIKKLRELIIKLDLYTHHGSFCTLREGGECGCGLVTARAAIGLFFDIEGWNVTEKDPNNASG